MCTNYKCRLNAPESKQASARNTQRKIHYIDPPKPVLPIDVHDNKSGNRYTNPKMAGSSL